MDLKQDPAHKNLVKQMQCLGLDLIWYGLTGVVMSLHTLHPFIYPSHYYVTNPLLSGHCFEVSITEPLQRCSSLSDPAIPPTQVSHTPGDMLHLNQILLDLFRTQKVA